MEVQSQSCLAVAAVVIATRTAVGRGPSLSALFDVAAGIALMPAFYWISALIHMDLPPQLKSRSSRVPAST